jgi:hypothetical protein
LREASRLDALWPVHAASRRAARRAGTRKAHRSTVALLRSLEAPSGATPVHVVAIFPEPTPYRAPLLDRVASLPEVELTVLYAADTVAGRTWRVAPKHEMVFLRGVRIPGAARVLHHDYPLTPGVIPRLPSRGAAFATFRTSSWWRATTRARGPAGAAQSKGQSFRPSSGTRRVSS